MSDAAKRAITFENLGLTGNKKCASKLDAINHGVNANALSKYQNDDLIRYRDLPVKLNMTINVSDVRSSHEQYSWALNGANAQYSHYYNSTQLSMRIGDTLVIGHGLEVGDSATIEFGSNDVFRVSDGVDTSDYLYVYHYNIRNYGGSTDDILLGNIEFQGYGTIKLIIKSNISS